MYVSDGARVTLHVCRRSGSYAPKILKRQRVPKTGVTVKTGSTCPAHLQAIEHAADDNRHPALLNVAVPQVTQLVHTSQPFLTFSS